jgi:hypothetical protein
MHWDAGTPQAYQKAARKPYKLIFAREITAATTVKTFLIDGFLGRDEVSIWFGAPECGKSTLLIDAACHVPAGLPWCGRPVMQGPVLYVAAERGQLVLRRVLAWRLHHRIDDFPLAVINDAVDLRTGRVDANRVIDAAKVLATMCGSPVVWIIFDTLSRALAGGDENSSRDMGLLLASVDFIHRETAAHCSLVHHVPLSNADRLRGHGSILGAVDVTVLIEKQDGVVTMKVEKANDLVEEEKPRHALQFKSITLTDEPLRTASVLVPSDKPAPAPKPMTPNKSRENKPVRTFRDAFDEALGKAGEMIRVLGDGPQVKAVAVKTVRKEFERRYVSGDDGDEEKCKASASRAFHRALTEYLPADFATETRDGRELIWKAKG